MHTVRSAIALVILASLLLATAPVSAAAAPVALEGRVVDLDGRAAAGHTVHLVDRDGATVATATTDAEGAYAIGSVPEGSYALGIETPAGELAPMAAPPMHLGTRTERRDLKLMRAPTTSAPADYGLGMWWAGLSPAGKTWVIVAVVAAVGLTISALDDDDETTASPDSPAE
jgi:hypothetical protein